MRGFKKLILAQNDLKDGEFIVAKDIASGGIKRYYIFESLDEFEEEQHKHRMHWYEIINGRQRLYIDIDIPASAEYADEHEDFIKDMKKHIRKELNKPTINIYSSHTKTRYSYHIVITDRYAKDNIDCKKQIEKLIKSFPDEDPLLEYVDLSVYKRNQLFRLLGSSKIDMGNTKIVYSGSEDLKDSLICNYI